MKTKILLMFVAFTLLTTLGCKKEKTPAHYVRVTNNYQYDVCGVTISQILFYGDVNTGTTTEYKKLPEEGGHDVVGTSCLNNLSSFSLNGIITVKGKGEHHYTLTFTSTGDLAFKED